MRKSSEDYKIAGTDLVIPKDTQLFIPIYAIQRDPDIYPNPDKYDPERFSPENKRDRHHMAWIPFGMSSNTIWIFF